MPRPSRHVTSSDVPHIAVPLWNLVHSLAELAKEGGYGQIFGRVIDEDHFAQMGPAAKAIYPVLSRYASARNGFVVRISFSNLARKSGSSLAKVKRGLQELIDRGAVQVTVEGGTDPTGRRVVSEYRLLIPVSRKRSPPSAMTPVISDSGSRAEAVLDAPVNPPPGAPLIPVKEIIQEREGVSTVPPRSNDRSILFTTHEEHLIKMLRDLGVDEEGIARLVRSRCTCERVAKVCENLLARGKHEAGGLAMRLILDEGTALWPPRSAKGPPMRRSSNDLETLRRESQERVRQIEREKAEANIARVRDAIGLGLGLRQSP